MEEKTILNGGLEEIQSILDMLNERDRQIAIGNEMAVEGKRLLKELQKELDGVEDEKKQAVKEALIKYTEEEDQIINSNKKRISEVEKSRSKAKNRGVKDRIDNETQELVTENKDLHRLIRRTLKENGLPAYCDTKWFYTLFLTQSALEWAIKILVFFAGLVLFPWLVTFIFSPTWKIKFLVGIVKVLEWAVVALIFGAVYLTIFLSTKDKDNGTLEAMREHRDKIHDNELKIRKIKRGIKTDSDESSYNLQEFDEELADLNSNLDQVKRIKEDKIKDFEENKKQQIMDEVDAAHLGSINELKDRVNDKAEEYKLQNDKVNGIIAEIEEIYSQVIPEKYLNEVGCGKIRELINGGQANNIGEALNILTQ